MATKMAWTWFCLMLLPALETSAAGVMQAAVLTNRSWDLKFHLDKVVVAQSAVPEPGRGEVLVKVYTSNINPVDHKIVEIAGLAWSYPHKLGFDLAGVVVSLGQDARRLKVGDEVWAEASGSALEGFSTGGTFAEYAAVPESVLGVKPKSLSWLEAGAMPMVALTGYESLTWAAGADHFPENTTVLVLGGSGGTGHLGIQLAKAMGAQTVITTCSSSHAKFVQDLGADRVIDYKVENYYDVLPAKSVDVVYDCVGLAGTGDHAAGLLRRGGAFITLLTTGLPSIRTDLARPDIRKYAPLCVGKCAQHDRMDAIAKYVEQGKLKVHVEETYELADIREAFNSSIAGHTTGKIALQIAGNGTILLV